MHSLMSEDYVHFPGAIIVEYLTFALPGLVVELESLGFA